MTDQRLAEALTTAVVLEREARIAWQHADTPVMEGQAALAVVRHVTATIRALEHWIAVRAAVV